MALTTLSFETPDALTDAFAQDLVSILKTGIKTRGRSSLVVSQVEDHLARVVAEARVDARPGWERVAEEDVVALAQVVDVDEVG